MMNKRGLELASRGRQTALLGGGAALLQSARRFSRAQPLGAASALFLIALCLVAAFAAQLAPYDPTETHPAVLRTPPSLHFLLGTDHLGRDVLSRMIYGARISLLVAFVAVAFGDGLGMIWGVVSGYLGGKFDLISQRLVDILLSFPSVILALLLMVGLGAGLHTVIIAIAVVRVPGSTRVVRSVALAVKEMQYIEAARASGDSGLRIMVRHVAPQCVAPLMVVASVGLGMAVFTEAALSFLALGVPPPHATWGNMLGGVLAEAFKPPWWLVLVPGTGITFTTLAFNLLGDALRDYLDPKLRGSLH